METASTDFPKALKVADSLYQVSESPHYQTKSLMLSASLYQQSGDVKNAVGFAEKAAAIISSTDDFVWKAKVYGFLSTQYRNLGLFNEAQKYINESLKTVKHIDNPRMINQTMGFIMQEKAYYEIEKKNYRKSIYYIEESGKYFMLSGEKDPFLMATNDQLLGLNYYYLLSDDKSLEYYNKALNKSKDFPDNFLKGLIYNGIAQVCIRKKDLKKAKENLNEANRIAKNSPYLQLKNEVYKTSQSYYLLVNDIESLKEVNIRKDSLVEKINDKSISFINHSYSNLTNESKSIQNKSQIKSKIIFLAIGLLTVIVICFFIYRRKQIKTLESVKHILDTTVTDVQKEESSGMEFNDIQSEVSEESIKHILDTTVTDVQKEESSGMEYNDIQSEVSDTNERALMSSVTEDRILDKLTKFESSKLYIRKNVSLPYVASFCNTNTKYLSHVINTYKKKDFKNYVNELRVKYIIEKLKTNPLYHKYKISTLAEEAGFSSQSKFAAAFKKVTSVSPSQFLQHLREIK